MKTTVIFETMDGRKFHKQSEAKEHAFRRYEAYKSEAKKRLNLSDNPASLDLFMTQMDTLIVLSKLWDDIKTEPMAVDTYDD